MTATDWNIKPRAHACGATGKPFAEGEKVHSALYWKDGAFERTDVCAEAWTARNENLRPLSFWQSAFEPPPPPPAEPIRKDDAASLLRRMLQENKPEQRNAAYILAVMLERKRLLKPLDRREESGQVILVYEHATTGECWLVPDPGLRLDELEAVQNEVFALLKQNPG